MGLSCWQAEQNSTFFCRLSGEGVVADCVWRELREVITYWEVADSEICVGRLFNNSPTTPSSCEINQ